MAIFNSKLLVHQRLPLIFVSAPDFRGVVGNLDLQILGQGSCWAEDLSPFDIFRGGWGSGSQGYELRRLDHPIGEQPKFHGSTKPPSSIIWWIIVVYSHPKKTVMIAKQIPKNQQNSKEFGGAPVDLNNISWMSPPTSGSFGCRSWANFANADTDVPGWLRMNLRGAMNFPRFSYSKPTLWPFNGLIWKPWPIEIDDVWWIAFLYLFNMMIFHGDVI